MESSKTETEKKGVSKGTSIITIILSVIAIVISVVSCIYTKNISDSSVELNKISTDGNTISEEGNTISEESNNISLDGNETSYASLTYSLVEGIFKEDNYYNKMEILNIYRNIFLSKHEISLDFFEYNSSQNETEYNYTEKEKNFNTIINKLEEIVTKNEEDRIKMIFFVLGKTNDYDDEYLMNFANSLNKYNFYIFKDIIISSFNNNYFPSFELMSTGYSMSDAKINISKIIDYYSESNIVEIRSIDELNQFLK